MAALRGFGFGGISFLLNIAAQRAEAFEYPDFAICPGRRVGAVGWSCQRIPQSGQ